MILVKKPPSFEYEVGLLKAHSVVRWGLQGPATYEKEVLVDRLDGWGLRPKQIVFAGAFPDKE